MLLPRKYKLARSTGGSRGIAFQAESNTLAHGVVILISRVSAPLSIVSNHLLQAELHPLTTSNSFLRFRDGLITRSRSRLRSRGCSENTAEPRGTESGESSCTAN